MTVPMKNLFIRREKQIEKAELTFYPYTGLW